MFFAFIALAASVHRLVLGPQSFNNYSIFEYSWEHLIRNANLYVLYTDQHNDLFKYSPTFAFFMGAFSLLPRSLGLISWNVLNMLAPVWAVSKLNLPQKQKNQILFIVFIELLSSVQNAQSNGIMLGLIIGAFACFEKNKPVLALLLISIGFYIKLFAVVAGALFLFYPQQGKSVLSGIIFLAVLGLLPLAAISWDDLLAQYLNWLALLRHDPAHELNFSIMTLAERLFHLKAADVFFLVPGAIILMLPLLRTKYYGDIQFRLLFLCSILIWVVIFNHKAESPTYCIAFGGIALWYVACQNRPDKIPIASRWASGRTIVFILAFILVALSPTDLFPAYIREHFITPYSLKALMPVVIWLWIAWDLLVSKHFSSADSLPTNQTA